MARKNVINIEVNEEQFKDFYERYQRYQEMLGEAPEKWREFNNGIADSSESMDALSESSVGVDQYVRDMAEKSAALSESMEKAFKASSGIHSHTLSMLDATRGTTVAHGELQGMIAMTSRSTTEMAQAAKSFSMFMRSGFSTLAAGGEGLDGLIEKLGKLGGPLGMLLGALAAGTIGAGLAITKLGKSAVDVQSQARQLGLRGGQLDSYRMNFSRYGDAQGLLENATDAQSDLEKLPQLQMATGKSMAQIQAMSPDELSIELMHAADKWWNSTPASMRNAQTFQASGLAGVMTFAQARGYGQMTNEEFDEAKQNHQTDQKDFDVSDKAADAAYKANREMDRTAMLFKRGVANDSEKLYPVVETGIKGLNDELVRIRKLLEPHDDDGKGSGHDGLGSTDGGGGDDQGRGNRFENTGPDGYMSGNEDTPTVIDPNKEQPGFSWSNLGHVIGDYFHPWGGGLEKLDHDTKLLRGDTITPQQAEAQKKKEAADQKIIDDERKREADEARKKLAEDAKKAEEMRNHPLAGDVKKADDAQENPLANDVKKADEAKQQATAGGFPVWNEAKKVAAKALGAVVPAAVANEMMTRWNIPVQPDSTASADGIPQGSALARLNVSDKDLPKAGREREMYVARALMELGLTPEQAAGRMGNWQQESGFNPRAVGDGGSAYGLEQWHSPRYKEFRQLFGHDIKSSKTTLAEEIEFSLWEEKHGDPLTRKGGRKLAQPGLSAEEYAKIYRVYIERPDPTHARKEDEVRGSNARIYESMIKGAHFNITVYVDGEKRNSRAVHRDVAGHAHVMAVTS